MAQRAGMFSGSGWGGDPFKTPEPKPAPAPRNTQHERTLCEAIATRALVELRYKDDVSYRLFAPHAVYTATTGKVNVSGTQIENRVDQLDDLEPRIFEVGRISRVRITGDHFQPDPRFDRTDPRYKNGIMCAVDRF